MRHIERTKVLLYVLDGIGPNYQGGAAGGVVVEGLAEEPAEVVYSKLKEELELYSPGLSQRPSIIWINKADLSPETATRAKQAIQEMIDNGEEDGEQGQRGEEESLSSRSRSILSTTPILMGSAMNGENIGRLAAQLRKIVQLVVPSPKRESGTTKERLDPIRLIKKKDKAAA